VVFNLRGRLLMWLVRSGGKVTRGNTLVRGDFFDLVF